MESERITLTLDQIELVRYFLRDGYVRSPVIARLSEGPRQYKKGHEVRIVADSNLELAQIGELIESVGLPKGKPFMKHSKLIQPMYGKEAAKSILTWLSHVLPEQIADVESRKRLAGIQQRMRKRRRGKMPLADPRARIIIQAYKAIFRH